VDATGPDVEPRLGLGPTGLLGSDVFDHVHPEDHQELNEAFARAAMAEAVTTTVGLRVGEEWRAVDLQIGALCQHRPQRLGMLLTFHCDARFAGEPSFPPAGETLVFGGQPLTVQQQEVVARLLRGENIATMAAGMHLSRSTVRNHLCAVYAKTGVHSQAGLIARGTGRHQL
jgi:DNA-binding CsgD family transcriptional regulator